MQSVGILEGKRLIIEISKRQIAAYLLHQHRSLATDAPRQCKTDGGGCMTHCESKIKQQVLNPPEFVNRARGSGAHPTDWLEFGAV